MEKISQKKLLKITQKTNGRCFYCNRDGEAIDHFLSKKYWEKENLNELLGDCRDNVENLFIACTRCNTIKNCKKPEDFFEKKDRICDRFKRANKRVGIKNSFELIFS